MHRSTAIILSFVLLSVASVSLYAETAPDDDNLFKVRFADRTVLASVRELKKIKYPDPATPDAIKRYIQSVIDASTMNWISSDDPQIKMLIKVGKENIALLFDAFRDESETNAWYINFYVTTAIETLADDTHKQLIIDSLPQYPALAEAIIRKDWIQDAKPSVIKVFETRDIKTIHPDFIFLLAEYKDITTYPFITKYITSNDNRIKAIGYARGLIGLDLAQAVQSAWDVLENQQRFAFAPTALEFGVSDAFKPLIDQIKGQRGMGVQRGGMWYGGTNTLGTLEKYTGLSGRDAIVEWWKAAEDRLTFDPVTKIYIIDETKPKKAENLPPPPPDVDF
ncbi:MAG: hypothetical protein ABIH86_04310 [Planctomycetota bacterium]